MAAGFDSVLALSGIWLAKRTTPAPRGFRSMLALSGIWITGKGSAPGPDPEPAGVSDLLFIKRRRSRR